MSQVINLFSTPIYEAKLSLNIEELQSYCYKCKSEDTGRQVSNRNGWQSNFIDLTDKTFLSLYTQLLSHMNNYKNLIGAVGNVELDSLWININPPGGNNVAHVHPGTFMSGTAYIQTDKQTGNIYFENPNPVGYDWKRNYFANPVWNKECNDTWDFVPANEVLYLFPSWAKHGVHTNVSTIDRISISFNGSIS
jgi:uncharacterized protein (TIGR02466 family)